MSESHRLLFLMVVGFIGGLGSYLFFSTHPVELGNADGLVESVQGAIGGLADWVAKPFVNAVGE